MAHYEVIVGNIGTVYRGSNWDEALAKFELYKDYSISEYGRAAGESVYLMDGQGIDKEYIGELDKYER